MHSISTNTKTGRCEVDAKKFFLPKLGVCGAYFVHLVILRIFVYVQFAQDPFFDGLTEHHVSNTYEWLHVFGVFLGTLYCLYFGVLAYAAVDIIRVQNDNYRYSTGATIFTMALSSILMICNGQVS